MALRHISPKIWRRVEVPAGASLDGLHQVIQTVMGWSDEYLHRFRIRNHSFGIWRPGGLLLQDSASLKLSAFAFRLNERLTYEYNFFDSWTLDVRFEGEQTAATGVIYPRCAGGARRAPAEDAGGPEVFMDRYPQYVQEGRRAQHAARTWKRIVQAVEDPALDDAALRARCRELLRERPAPEFDRHAVNAALLTMDGKWLRGDEDMVHGHSHSADH
jgi:hypothetical protein